MPKEINLFQLSLPTLEEPIFEKAGRVDKVERLEKNHLKKIVEALLFASSEPISFNRLREIIETKLSFKPKTLRDAINDLQEDYEEQQRSFHLEETELGFLLKTREKYGTYVEQLFRNKRTEKLSQAAIEVIAIIAYKQPITKPQIDSIRGVDCSGILQNLLERGLIETAGKLEAPGRPTLYATTPHFLSHFGLRNLSELPQ